MAVYKVTNTAVEADPDPTAPPRAKVVQTRLIEADTRARAIAHVSSRTASRPSPAASLTLWRWALMA